MNELTKERIAEKVISAVEESKMLQKDVAELLNVNASSMSQIKRPDQFNRVPSIDWEKMHEFVKSGLTLKEYKHRTKLDADIDCLQREADNLMNDSINEKILLGDSVMVKATNVEQTEEPLQVEEHVISQGPDMETMNQTQEVFNVEREKAEYPLTPKEALIIPEGSLLFTIKVHEKGIRIIFNK